MHSLVSDLLAHARMDKTACVTCNKTKVTYPCEGCKQRFCLDDLSKHRQNLRNELDQIKTNHDQLRQDLNEQKSHSMEQPVINEINQWELDSIEKIKQKAQQFRDQFIKHFDQCFREIEKELNCSAGQIQTIHEEDEFTEFDLSNLRQTLARLQGRLTKPADLSLKKQSTVLIDKVSLFMLSNTSKNHKLT